MAKHPAFSAEEFMAGMAEGGVRAERVAREFISAYRPLLRRRFYAKRVPSQDIEDLIAEVLSGVVRGIHKLRSPEAFRTWVLAIADNILNQHWTDKGRDRATFLSTDSGAMGAVDGSDPEAGEGAMEFPDLSHSDPVTRLCLSGQFAKFKRDKPDRHDCIDLLVQGYDAREIAEMLGRSYGATRQFISQCCAVLLEYLRPCLDPGDLNDLRRGRAQGD